MQVLQRTERLRNLTVAAVVWYGVAAAGVALVTALIALMQARAGAGRLQMSYLLLVLVLAIAAGRGPAVFASILSFLVFDWYFVKPVGNLVVSDPEEWFALGLFLVVGVSTGTLAAGLKKNAAEARRRGNETATLLDLSTALLAGPDLSPVLEDVVQRLLETLELRAATVKLLDLERKLRPAASTAVRADFETAAATDSGAEGALTSTDNPLSRLRSRSASATTNLEVEDGQRLRGYHLPLVLNGRILGVVSAYTLATGTPLQETELRLFAGFAAQTALAVGRVRLIEEEERARAAEASDRLRSAFLASISHDLRTPITTIKTAAAVLQSRTGTKERTEATLSIEEEADRLNQLVGNLLEMSRIEAGGAPPRLAPEDLSEIVGSTAARMVPLLAGRLLELSAGEDLPLVAVDAPQIGRVITNLLENAIKFSPVGSTIAVDLRPDGSCELIRVHNVATSIPEEDQLRIFDKFHRIGRESSMTSGAGLGLAICKGIVEAHGGRIWTCNEDRGVAFYVQIPACPERETDMVAPQGALQ